MMRRIIFLSLFFVCFNSLGQTFVFQDIDKNTIWTKANSPYYLKDSITVFRGDTLVIEAGTQLFGDKNKILFIEGVLLIEGEKNDSVIFSVDHEFPDLNNFGGIEIADSGKAHIRYFKTTYAKKGLFIRNKASVNISKSSFNSSKVGIYFEPLAEGEISRNYSVELDSLTFENNNIAIENISDLTISNSVFTKNQYGLFGARRPSVQHNVFRRNTEKAIEGSFGNIVSNTFLYNNVGLSYSVDRDLIAYVPTNIEGNIFKYNDVAFEITEGPFNAYIAGNSFCYSTFYNIQNRTSYTPDLKENCWCKIDSISIRNSIYDRYKNIDLGAVKYMPLHTNCPLVDSVWLKGAVYPEGSQGVVYLFKNDSIIDHVEFQDSFRFDHVVEGDYKILAISDQGIYLPTFYYRGRNIGEANSVGVVGNTGSVDVRLRDDTNVSAGTAKFQVLDDAFFFLADEFGLVSKIDAQTEELYLAKRKYVVLNHHFEEIGSFDFEGSLTADLTEGKVQSWTGLAELRKNNIEVYSIGNSIQVLADKEVFVQLLSFQGKLIGEKKGQKNEFINLDNMPYLLLIYLDKKRFVEKIIIE